jgi:hypothetical protein
VSAKADGLANPATEASTTVKQTADLRLRMLPRFNMTGLGLSRRDDDQRAAEECRGMGELVLSC